MSERRRTPLIWGVFFIVVGGLFLLEELGAFDLRARYVLPVLVIVIGTAVLVGGRASPDG